MELWRSKSENGETFNLNGQRLKPYFAGEIMPKAVEYPLGNPIAT